MRKQKDGGDNGALAPISCRQRQPMRSLFALLSIIAATTACTGKDENAKSSPPTRLTVTTTSLAVINIVGMDTLSDSSSIHRLQPEPDGGSIAFLFADPAKGVAHGLGLANAAGASMPQLAWPDSVRSFWWSGAHQLSFTAGTGQGVRVVVDAHAAQLEALEAADLQRRAPSRGAANDQSTTALARAQAFIDSVRVQPGGTPQESALRYRADSVILAPGDTFAAVHVSVRNSQGATANPAWYIAHVPSGNMQAVDSLTGTSSGLPASAGQWDSSGTFYYAKERSIWRAQPRTH